MTSSQETLSKLREEANSANLEGMKRYRMAVDNRLEVSVSDMRLIIKGIGKDHAIAFDLWKRGIAEGKIVASMFRWVRRLPSGSNQTRSENWKAMPFGRNC